MSSMLEQLWPVFVAEVGEKLDVLDTLLGTGDNADIDALFREFHSIKSSFSMVDFQCPMALAHACEDVLHAVRRHRQPYSAEIQQCLIQAVDWLKQQLGVAQPGHYPQTLPEALLDSLAPFRPPEDDDAATAAGDTATTSSSAAAPDKLAEEREALAVDTLRISSASLDHLVTNVSQLSLRENAMAATAGGEQVAVALAQAHAALQTLRPGDPPAAALAEAVQVLQHYRQQLQQADAELQSAITGIQQDVLALRVIPLSTIFNRLPRIVRKQAAAAGKQVQLALEGGEVLIDKGMIELVSEPLIQLLHNAITHGIELPESRQAAGKPANGHISIRATEQGALLRIEIRDDGAGIAYQPVREKAVQRGLATADAHGELARDWLQYLFAPGFSTHQAGDTSGLDVVKSRLAAIGGNIEIDSTPGEGTSFQLRMPVTVAIQSVILVQSAGQTYAVPSRHVVEIIELPRDTLQVANNQAAILLRGNMLPVYTLARLFETGAHVRLPALMMLLVLQCGEHCIALGIDAMLGRQELFLRDIHQDLRNIPGVGGVSLLGDGQVVLILDCDELFRLAQVKPQRLEQT